MHNPWKLATLGVVALGATVGTSTLTTAYLMRPPMTAPEATAASVAPPVAPPVRPRPAVVRVAPAPTRHAVAPAVTARVVPTVADAPPALPAQAATPPSTASRPTDCHTGGDRALRIAEPGALGAVLGAGVGAAGGAMASGGKGAGKGALIGGLAGAALGGGYGAYTTKHECGTIFGGETPKTGPGATQPAGSRATREEAIQSTLALPRQSRYC